MRQMLFTETKVKGFFNFLSFHVHPTYVCTTCVIVNYVFCKLNCILEFHCTVIKNCAKLNWLSMFIHVSLFSDMYVYVKRAILDFIVRRWMSANQILVKMAACVKTILLISNLNARVFQVCAPSWNSSGTQALHKKYVI